MISKSHFFRACGTIDIFETFENQVCRGSVKPREIKYVFKFLPISDFGHHKTPEIKKTRDLLHKRDKRK